MVARINAEASTPEGEEAVLDRLSKQLGASPDSLRAQHSAWGLGYGEVAMAYGFARASKKPGVTPEQVVELRRGGMAWDAVDYSGGGQRIKGHLVRSEHAQAAYLLSVLEVFEVLGLYSAPACRMALTSTPVKARSIAPIEYGVTLSASTWR